jgi:hypothetical protein
MVQSFSQQICCLGNQKETARAQVVDKLLLLYYDVDVCNGCCEDDVVRLDPPPGAENLKYVAIILTLT